ncbi:MULTISPECIES: HsdM family class I SAM-dependent methyltransferase [Microbacterium]|uniref:HsdM family class I SAM-dependent methyltransferase n=1 Tax=Microbacterium TaxID=33882 RepID=UPI00217EE1B4|nr:MULTISPECIES: N-6 DNA methylase [Microbacterium]
MTSVTPEQLADTAELRKARGAFFTPSEITEFIAGWALRDASDRVMEPSAGDAAFLIAAVKRLHSLADSPQIAPRVDGVEIHAHSAEVARRRVMEAGGIPAIQHDDFFCVEPLPTYDAVIGNPPYIRYQDFSGESRMRARAAALRAGVPLTGLASSWAAFTVHGAQFLRPGGRLGLVLPAELLSVNYAAPVRRFLFDSFADVTLVLFDEQVFPEAEADVVLLLADGFGLGPATHATIRQTRNAETLPLLDRGSKWQPMDPSAKWTSSLITAAAADSLISLADDGAFRDLETWGDTTLGIVTGNNRFFTMSPARAAELGLAQEELVRLSPPGSAHLRGLSLTTGMLTRLGADGSSTLLFAPGETLSSAAAAYIESGHRTGVDTAYKCRVRKPWYKVPLVPPADLLLTCMNADTPRLTTNTARAHHLNSVHGVYLADQHRDLGVELLPLASLNSVTVLHAELVGRAYGGGILKIEPREADRWLMPSPALVRSRAERLREIRPAIGRLLRQGRLLDAVHQVDEVLLEDPGVMAGERLALVRDARIEMARRRTARGQRAR